MGWTQFLVGKLLEVGLDRGQRRDEVHRRARRFCALEHVEAKRFVAILYSQERNGTAPALEAVQCCATPEGGCPERRPRPRTVSRACGSSERSARDGCLELAKWPVWRLSTKNFTDPM